MEGGHHGRGQASTLHLPLDRKVSLHNEGRSLRRPPHAWGQAAIPNKLCQNTSKDRDRGLTLSSPPKLSNLRFIIAFADSRAGELPLLAKPRLSFKKQQLLENMQRRSAPVMKRDSHQSQVTVRGQKPSL
jgi:hypothetical protein